MYANTTLLYKNFFYWSVLLDFNKQWIFWRTFFQSYFGNIYFREPKRVKHYHNFHILAPSPWPFCVSISVLMFASGIIDLLTLEQDWRKTLLSGLFAILFCVWAWWVDVVNESLTEHTNQIKFGIAVGMILFIVSEIMFFFSFFWAFFHVSLAPGIELGCVWPPKGLESLVIEPFGAPLLNTLILVISGITVTCAHHAFLQYAAQQKKVCNFLTIWGELNLVKILRYLTMFRHVGTGWLWFILRYVAIRNFVTFRLEYLFLKTKDTLYYNLLKRIVQGNYFSYTLTYFGITLILAVLFTISQAVEYLVSAISISDGAYGSTFFIMTGFHGFHVIVGTIFLFVCFFRIITGRISFIKFIGLECAIWYWHFVDVVWLFLFIFVYIWGNGIVPVISLEFFPGVVVADFAKRWQFGFQDSASVLMESIIDLHHYIMFYLCLIFGLVTWMLIAFCFLNVHGTVSLTINRFHYLFVHHGRTRERISRRLFFIFNEEELKDTKAYWLMNLRDRNLPSKWKTFFTKVHEAKKAEQ
jgi:heme/copper-type cytochrome/quinol oxidase subunit 3